MTLSPQRRMELRLLLDRLYYLRNRPGLTDRRIHRLTRVVVGRLLNASTDHMMVH